MRPEEKAGLHEIVFRASADYPEYIGFWLGRHLETEKLRVEQLAEKLDVAMANLVALCMCHTPRSDHFREDVEFVCKHAGASSKALIQILRQEQTLHAWQTSPPAEHGWQAAASDRGPNQSKPINESESDDQQVD